MYRRHFCVSTTTVTMRLCVVDGGRQLSLRASPRRCIERSFHATRSQANNKTDTRLSGRLRFYKEVGVAPLAAPWESFKEDRGIESPIGAGVDGTQSASGVSLDVPKKSTLEKLLTPRRVVDTQRRMQPTRWFGITLDGRSIKTPLGQTLAVPSQTLAWAIAAEWDAQDKTLQPAQMPLMTLVCTTLDQTAAHVDIPKQHILQYLPTDTTCYWADPLEDRVLHRKQEQSWRGLHEWAAHALESEEPPACAVGASEGLLLSRKRTNKPHSGLPHPPQLVQGAHKWVDGLDAWQLTAMHSVAAQAKSFFVAMAVVSAANYDTTKSCTENPFAQDLQKATMAARVEEEFQIDNWGLVEGGHDYDRLNCSVQMHSAHFVLSTIATENFME